MKRLCVIGEPIEHSLSPAMHNGALKFLGLENDFHTEILRIPAGGLEQFTVDFRDGKYFGAIVTMPYKQAILPFLDRLTEEAEISRAVNTVIRNDDLLEGHNTDGAGCIRALKATGMSVKGKKAVLLGAGGTAGAAAVSLAFAGIGSIRILNRTPARAEELAAMLRSRFGADARAIGSSPNILDDADILINATPEGTDGGCPVDPKLLKRDMTVLDAVYRPGDTELIRAARAAGSNAIPGTELLLQQGVLQFKLFTGNNAPMEVMRATLEVRT